MWMMHAACGRLPNLCQWWDKLCKNGPSFDYFSNTHITWLVMKDRYHFEEETIFASTHQLLVDYLTLVLQLGLSHISSLRRKLGVGPLM